MNCTHCGNLIVQGRCFGCSRPEGHKCDGKCESIKYDKDMSVPVLRRMKKASFVPKSRPANREQVEWNQQGMMEPKEVA